MGCFLTITDGDLQRLSSALKDSVTRMDYYVAGKAVIQVNATSFHSASEMAERIRNQAKSARSTSGSGSVHAKAEANSDKEALRQFKAFMTIFGKEDAEEVARDILVKTGHLDGGQKVKIGGDKGIDIVGVNVAGYPVIVEVKFTSKDGSVWSKLGKHVYKDAEHPKGMNQMDNDWIPFVAEKYGQLSNVDPSRTNIMCVMINPINETVNVFRRASPDAKKWDPLFSGPLATYKVSLWK